MKSIVAPVTATALNALTDEEHDMVMWAFEMIGPDDDFVDEYEPDFDEWRARYHKDHDLTRADDAEILCESPIDAHVFILTVGMKYIVPSQRHKLEALIAKLTFKSRLN
jgi:hypothetical protein